MLRHIIIRSMLFAVIVVGLSIASVAIAADAEYTPGTKVIVDFAGEHEGVIIERTRLGMYKVKIQRRNGREGEMTVPANKIRLPATAKPTRPARTERPAATKNGTSTKAPNTPHSGPAQAAPSEKPAVDSTNKPKAAASTSKPADDLKSLQGKWLIVKHYFGDRELKSDEDFWEFKDDRCDRYGSAYTFKIDPTASPKRIDFITERGTILPAIYELDGDTLLICQNDSGEPTRPDKLGVNDRFYRYCVCKRYTGPIAPTPEVKAELDKLLSDAAALVEADKYDAFVELGMPPELRAKMSAEMIAKTAEHVQQNREDVLATFRALKTMMPEMNYEQTVANYRFPEDTQIKRLPPNRKMKFQKTGGRWYMGG